MFPNTDRGDHAGALRWPGVRNFSSAVEHSFIVEGLLASDFTVDRDVIRTDQTDLETDGILLRRS